MKKYIGRICLSLVLAAVMLFAAAIPAAALNDIYRFDEFGMSVKVPKGYHVILRDTPADDPIFRSLQISYQDTMNEFRDANIYLCAYDPEWLFQLRLKVSRTENSEKYVNYADVSEGELKAILDRMLASYPGANKVKLGEYIFFKTLLEDSSGEETIYINKYETIVNSLQIELTLRKSGEPIAESEAKALVALATSIEFDEVQQDPAGFAVDWWRVILWALILIALTIVLSLAARHRNNVRLRRFEERRLKREEAAAAEDTAPTVSSADEDVSFDEALGYRDADQFSARAGTDLESFDINVREKDPSLGVSYFEDGGKSIDDRSGDYFDSYFKEPTPARSGIARLFSTVGAYIGIAFRHVGYFFRNLWNSLFRRNKKQP